MLVLLILCDLQGSYGVFLVDDAYALPKDGDELLSLCRYIGSEWKEGILRERQHLLWSYFILEPPAKPHKGIRAEGRRACNTSTLAVSTLIN